MPRKKKIVNIKTDSMFDLFSVAQKNTNDGIGPKDKKKQIHALDIVGDNSLELFGEEKANKIEAKKYKKYSNCGEIEWNQIKSKPDKRAMMEPKENWVSKHFYLYVRDKYQDRYKSDIPCQRNAAIEMMKKLKISFSLLTNIEASPQSIVDYIDWFFANQIDRIISVYGTFNIQSLRYEQNIKTFYSQYSSIKSHTIFKEHKIDTISFINMDVLFKASRVNFIIKYGIVYTLNWLIKNKNINEIEARDITMEIIKNAMKEGESTVTRIISETKNFSPYPLAYKKSCLKDIFSFIFIGNNEIKYEENIKDNF